MNASNTSSRLVYLDRFQYYLSILKYYFYLTLITKQ